MWNSYNILTFTILRHFRTVPTGTVRILWFFLVLRNFWVGTVKKTTLYQLLLSFTNISVALLLSKRNWHFKPSFLMHLFFLSLRHFVQRADISISKEEDFYSRPRQWFAACLPLKVFAYQSFYFQHSVCHKTACIYTDISLW